MKKYTFVLALIATMILSSCSLFKPVITDIWDKDTTVVQNDKDTTKTDDNTKTPVVNDEDTDTDNVVSGDWVEYTDAEKALVGEKGIVVYVDPSCDTEDCKEETVKEILEQQLMWGKTIEMKKVDITDDKWSVFSKTMSGSPIVGFDKVTIDEIVAATPGVEPYLQIIGDKTFLMLWNWGYGQENLCSDGIDNNGDGAVDADDASCNTVAILYDSRCTEGELCDIEQLEESLGLQTFNLWFIMKTIDYTTEEWKALYEKVGEWLPVLLADNLPVDMEKWLQDAQLLDSIDDENYKFVITFLGGDWDPSGEICNNEIDDDGNGQIDCADTACASKKQCREEIKGKLDVFLMGYCPFGEIAAKQIPALQEALGEDMELWVHFIANQKGEWEVLTADDFDSLHGTPEAEENIRQLCVQKYHGIDKLVEYMQVRYENANNYGQVEDKPSIALEAIGADVEQITTCVSGWEWGAMLAEDVKIANELNIWASPTWLANNRYEFGGIEANAILSEFCKYNPEFEACVNNVELETEAPAAGDPSCE